MADFFKGSEIKFAIELTAQGFSMDADDFDIEVTGTKGSIRGNKGNTTGDENIIIFREPELPDSSSDSSSSSSEPAPAGTWYAIINSDVFDKGEMKVIGTAYIPDANANDGVRTDIAVASLGNLKKAK